MATQVLKNESGTAKIFLPQMPFKLRMNKIAGSFALGEVPAVSERDRLKSDKARAEVLRGFWIEFIPVHFQTDLVGKLGKDNFHDDWSYFAGVLVAAGHEKLYRGVLVHLYCYGDQTKELANLHSNIELEEVINAEFGKVFSPVIRIEFDETNAFKSKQGTEVLPPKFTVRDAVNDELEFATLAKTIDKGFIMNPYEDAPLTCDEHGEYNRGFIPPGHPLMAVLTAPALDYVAMLEESKKQNPAGVTPEVQVETLKPAGVTGNGKKG